MEGCVRIEMISKEEGPMEKKNNKENKNSNEKKDSKRKKRQRNSPKRSL